MHFKIWELFVFISLFTVNEGGVFKTIQRDWFISNSTVAGEGQALYHVAIRSRLFGDATDLGLVNCGGALISSKAVLTSCQCIEKTSQWTNMEITGGNIDRDSVDKHTYVGSPSNIILHPNYNDLTHENDVAIIFLKTPVARSHPTFKPIRIESMHSNEGRLCRISGFGYTNNNLLPSMKLMLGTTMIAATMDCSSDRLPLGDYALCTSNGSYTCLGDTGGPLVCDGKLVGIITMGMDCGVFNSFSIYTNVSMYNHWIRSHNPFDGAVMCYSHVQQILLTIVSLFVVVGLKTL